MYASPILSVGRREWVGKGEEEGRG